MVFLNLGSSSTHARTDALRHARVRMSRAMDLLQCSMYYIFIWPGLCRAWP